MGWLLAQNVVMAAALAGVSALVCRLRRVGPVARHALWLVVLVKLVTPPVLILESSWMLPLPSAAAAADGGAPLSRSNADLASRAPMTSRPPFAAGSEAPLTRFSAPPASGGDAAVAPSGRSTDGVAGVAGWIAAMASAGFSTWILVPWSAGALGFIALQMLRAARVMRQVSRGWAAPPDLTRVVDDVRARLRLAPIPIVVVPGLRSPLMWCLNLRRPVLLWPEQLPDDASPACVGGLVTHELAHIKRRDHWVGWLELVAGTLWWWNPLFWFVRARVRENAELACDAWVIDTMPDGRRAYAEALLAACTIGPSRIAPMPAVGISTGSRRFLERRLAMIMQDRVPVRLSRVAAVSLVLTAIATLPVWAARMVPADGQQAKPVVPVTVVAPPAIDAVSVPIVVTEPAGAQDRRVVRAPAEAPRQGRHLEVVQDQLPEDALKLVQKFEQQQADARKEMEARLATERDALVKQLQALQDSYTKAGKLDEAVAIRDRIRGLTHSETSARGNFWSYGEVPSEVHLALPETPQPFGWARRGEGVDVATRYDAFTVFNANDPIKGAIQALRGQPASNIVVEVEGADLKSGHVWGTDIYSDDSSVAAAAVHAGLLRPGEKGLLRVILMPGQASYTGSERHSVKSESFGQWPGSFKLEKVDKK
jgi:beta-lactamase regulating signal transducer with metallopeptidase domain